MPGTHLGYTRVRREGGLLRRVPSLPKGEVNVSAVLSCYPDVIPVSLLGDSRTSLCNTAFCTGFNGHNVGFLLPGYSRFTVGGELFPHEDPFHCWSGLTDPGPRAACSS